MSGIKRTLSTDDNEQPITPNDSPDSKKLRHASSHSEETEEETQIIDSQNGITNGKNKFNPIQTKSFVFRSRSFNKSI
jgi:hypothetical protein